MQHENVCRVYEVGEVDGKQYIAMQLIEGKTLSAAAKELSLEAKVRVIKQIADALHVAHKEGLIHRDIKPSNIMLERNEEKEWKPYVLDFGLARDQDAPGLTRTGMAVGTPYYMAPEQVSSNSDQLDRRTDVYGLGATLYELLSGMPPYQGKSGAEILLQILKDDPVHARQSRTENTSRFRNNRDEMSGTRSFPALRFSKVPIRRSSTISGWRSSYGKTNELFVSPNQTREKKSTGYRNCDCSCSYHP